LLQGEALKWEAAQEGLVWPSVGVLMSESDSVIMEQSPATP